MGFIRLNSQRIREQAKAGRWSSHSIAAASGGQVSQPTVSKLMSNRFANPAAIKLKKICEGQEGCLGL